MNNEKFVNNVVQSILFDVEYKGIKYCDVDFGYHNDPDITKEYIYDEDGPWSMIELTDGIMLDFQIYGEDGSQILYMQAYEMVLETKMIDNKMESFWHHGRLLKNDYDIKISNIRVEYVD